MTAGKDRQTLEGTTLEIITVKFTQWKKWNPRRDIRHPSWFAMSNRITEDDQIQTLSDIEFRAFIHIFCLASQQQGNTAVVNVPKASRVTGIKKPVFARTISKLQTFGICELSDGSRTDDVRMEGVGSPQDVQDASPTIQYKTIHPFDLEEIFRAYPKRPNTDKAAGLASLANQIKTVDEFRECLFAAQNYAEHVRREGTEPKFIKQFKTWVGSKKKPTWREWVEQIPSPNTTGIVER